MKRYDKIVIEDGFLLFLEVAKWIGFTTIMDNHLQMMFSNKIHSS